MAALPIGPLRHYKRWKKEQRRWRTSVRPHLLLPPEQVRRQKEMFFSFRRPEFIRSGLTSAALGLGLGGAAGLTTDIIRRALKKRRQKRRDN